MMLAKIEEAVIAHLKKNWPDAIAFDLGKGFSDIISYPAVAATIENIGFVNEAAGISSGRYLLEPTVSVYTVFKSPQPGFRHKGIYPMVELAAALLVGRDLGLEIEPLVPAGPIREVFSQAFIEQGCVVFQIDVKTAFALEIKEDGDITALLQTFNKYYYRDWKSGTQEIELPNDLAPPDGADKAEVLSGGSDNSGA